MKKQISFDSEGLKLIGDFYFVDKEAPTLILLHGMSFYSFEYEKLAPLLAMQNFNVLTFDFRCHGGSEGERGDWRLKGLAIDVACALNFLEGQVNGSIGVFGNSLGAVVAVYAAARDSRIKSLACCNTATSPSKALYTPFRKALLSLMKIVSKVIPFTINVSYFIPTPLVLSDKKLIRRIENDQKVLEARRFTAKTYSEMILWDASEEIKKTGIPILVLYGTGDRLQPASQSEMLFAAAKGPKQMRLMDAGHVPTLENAEDLCQVLSDWFKHLSQ